MRSSTACNNANPARRYTVNLATMVATAFASTMSVAMGDLASSPQADINLSKTNSSTSTVAGTSTTYSIVASNSGPGGSIRVPVVDTAPADLTFGSWTCATTGAGVCAAASGTGNLNTFADLPSTATATYAVNATLAASASGTIANTATAGDLTGVADLAPGTNTATDTDTVLRQANLIVTMMDGVARVNAAGTTSYTIVVSNAGPSTAHARRAWPSSRSRVPDSSSRRCRVAAASLLQSARMSPRRPARSRTARASRLRLA